ncbi:MAG: response regulator [Candidatus Desulforudis sp.]|nr:response regulator [Desulforudis sp.]
MDEVKVVVIDDDDSVRWLFQEMLSLENIPHRAAGTGVEGLELVSKHKPCLAIVDIKLGAMNGLEVARQIRISSADTQILFVTGYDDVLEGKVNEDLPVVAIIEKPFDVPGLLRLVKSVITR